MINLKAISALRVEKDPVGTIGSYNAYCQKGERFKSAWTGEPATVFFSSTEITINTLENNSVISSVFRKEGTQILWVGYSGRSKDYLTWILIKDADKAVFISNFIGEYESSSDRYATELFYSLTDLGFSTGLETKRRGAFLQIVVLLSMIIIGISQVLSGETKYGIFSICLSLAFGLFLTLDKKKLPKRIQK